MFWNKKKPESQEPLKPARVIPCWCGSEVFSDVTLDVAYCCNCGTMFYKMGIARNRCGSTDIARLQTPKDTA